MREVHPTMLFVNSFFLDHWVKLLSHLGFTKCEGLKLRYSDGFPVGLNAFVFSFYTHLVIGAFVNLCDTTIVHQLLFFKFLLNSLDYVYIWIARAPPDSISYIHIGLMIAFHHSYFVKRGMISSRTINIFFLFGKFIFVLFLITCHFYVNLTSNENLNILFLLLWEFLHCLIESPEFQNAETY